MCMVYTITLSHSLMIQIITSG